MIPEDNKPASSFRNPEEISPVTELRKIGTGEIDAFEALRIIRQVLKSTEEDWSKHVYAALRDRVWKQLTARDYSVGTRKWYDVVRQSGALLRNRDKGKVADMLDGFAELLAQSVRFGELQPLDEVLKRKHVSEILELIRVGGGVLPRHQIAEILGLADANLSRILAILQSNGLVERVRDGKYANFELTALGIKNVPMPSLFERVTGHNKLTQTETTDLGEKKSEASSLRPRLGGLDQGERPQESPEEDLLDIPAFLRSQAN